MERVLLVIVFIAVIAFFVAVYEVPFSINQSERHLKRIADALEKIAKKEDSSR